MDGVDRSSEPMKEENLRCLNLSSRFLRSRDGLVGVLDPSEPARVSTVAIDLEEVVRLRTVDGRTVLPDEFEDCFDCLLNRRGRDKR